MKREEKVQQTRRKIMEYALREFAVNGYSASSVNNMYDSEQGISKGLIYHYFTSKEELFLACVSECFEELASYMQTHFTGSSMLPLEKSLTDYFTVRLRFFYEHPLYQRIFMESVFIPQGYLSEEIDRCREPMDQMNINLLEELFSRVPLRISMSSSEAARIFIAIVNTTVLRRSAEKGNGFSIQEREETARSIVDILLNGLVDKTNEKTGKETI